jgi:hypothetical protein
MQYSAKQGEGGTFNRRTGASRWHISGTDEVQKRALKSKTTHCPAKASALFSLGFLVPERGVEPPTFSLRS